MHGTPADAITRRAFLTGSLVAGGALLSGCGNSSSSEETPTTLQVGIPTDIQPGSIQVFLAANQPLRQTVFDYLLDRNADGSYRPALATSWEWNADQTSLVLTLRDDVTFHTGRPFGPDDIITSIQAALQKGSGVQVAQLLKLAGDVRRTGGNQVTVSFDSPSGGYLDALAALPIIDTETAANLGDGSQVIGTGPFKFRSWSPGSTVELERNASYWKGAPRLSELVLNVITEPQATLAAVRAGDVELANRMLPRDAATLQQDDGYTVGATEGFDVYVGVNTRVRPLDDVRVRQAIAYALDRKRIADQVYQGFAEPSCVPWASSTPGVTKEQITRYAFDVEKGRALLEQAGAAGTEVALTSFAADPAYGDIQEIVQFCLEEIGLDVKPVTYDQAEFVQHLQAADMPGLWVTPVALTTLGPTTALLTAMPLTPGENTSNFTAPEYGSLVDAVVTAPTDADLATATRSLTDYMLQQAFHLTVVQARTPIAGVAGLRGVRADLTLALDLSKARLVA